MGRAWRFLGPGCALLLACGGPIATGDTDATWVTDTCLDVCAQIPPGGVCGGCCQGCIGGSCVNGFCVANTEDIQVVPDITVAQDGPPDMYCQDVCAPIAIGGSCGGCCTNCIGSACIDGLCGGIDLDVVVADVPDAATATCVELGCGVAKNPQCIYKACNPQTGLCEFQPFTAPCDDGSPCTTGESCWDGSCVGGTATPCDDGNGCTADSCDPGAVGCVHLILDGTPCDDGQACSLADACTASACVGTAKVCDDGLACTEDSCQPSLGECSHMPLANCSTPCTNAATCDDGSPATKDLCVSGLCVHSSLASECVLGSECDDGDVCSKDECVIDKAWPIGVCGHTAVAGCCTSNDADMLAKQCGTAKCGTFSCDLATDSCIYAKSADLLCCDDDAQCAKNFPNAGCTFFYCAANTCVQSPKQPGCCTSDADCPVLAGEPPCPFPETGKCPLIQGLSTGWCQYSLTTSAGCDGCWSDGECNDGDCATADHCNGPGSYSCSHPLIDGFCKTASDCVDGNPCTFDTCGAPGAACPTIGSCVHSFKPGCS